MDPVADDALPAGTIVGEEFEIVRELGRGGMGVVYEAVQRSTGVRRALKVMHRDLLDDPHLRRRFRDEAAIIGSVRSDHVVRVIAAGFDEASAMPWVAMELLRGRTLDAFVRENGPPRWNDAREILEQIAHALGAAHRHDPIIVHRDLKPENVFLAETERAEKTIDVKLLDFGIAKTLDPVRRRGTASVAIGSPQWMAPEQFEESTPITPATDVWAFGLVAFFVLTGRTYWRAANAPRISRAELFAEVSAGATASATQRASALGVRDRLPNGFDTWFAKATATDAANRFGDATAAFEALRVLSPPSRDGSPLRTIALAGAAVAVAAGLGTFAWRRSHRVPTDVARHVTPARPAPVETTIDASVATLARPTVANTPSDAGSHSDGRPVAPSQTSSGPCPRDMVLVPAGSFVMGSVVPTRFTNQTPSHLVTLDAYCFDRREVTASQYLACATNGACPPAQRPPNAGREYQYLCNALQPDRGDHPMNCVSWNDAAAYCLWSHRRLPTESEWEFAARGRTGRRYPWGEAPPDAHRLNAAGVEWTGADAGDYTENDGFPTTAPVGSFPDGATPEGVLDLSGNVSEWVADWAGPYPEQPQLNPTGPDGGISRIARGGGFLDPPLSATWRERINANYVGRSLGFRCARGRDE